MEFPCKKFDVGIRKKRKKNLTLQNYLHFIESQKQLDLTVDLLNNKAINDLISLNQMECAITSFKTVNSENYSMLSLENENTSSSESNLN